MHSSPVATPGRRTTWLFAVVAVVAISIAGVLFASWMAERRVAEAHTADAAKIESACDAIGAYEMTLDLETPDDPAVVEAAWAQIDAVPPPSPLAPAVADARARVEDLVRAGHYTTSAGAAELARACATLVGVARLVAGPPGATPLGGPS
jgi:hypothetical protein